MLYSLLFPLFLSDRFLEVSAKSRENEYACNLVVFSQIFLYMGDVIQLCIPTNHTL